MVGSDFAHIRHWVFDLDNTLYDPKIRLFDQIEDRMRRFIVDALSIDPGAAETLRRDYWQRYGTTLAGLMAEHEVDAEAFLVDVHDISFDALLPDADLCKTIEALPGRKIVYTNGSKPYAENVLKHRGLAGAFEAVYGIEHAAYRPKPQHAAFERVFSRAQIDPKIGAMFEDEPRNLKAPHALGMRTVHVAPDPVPEDHIHHHTDGLSGFLKQLGH